MSGFQEESRQSLYPGKKKYSCGVQPKVGYGQQGDDRDTVGSTEPLFRNFNVQPSVQPVDRGYPALLEYRDRSSPRHEIAVYTSTDYPAEQKNFYTMKGCHLASENLLCCLTAPSQEEDRRLFFSTHHPKD